MGFPAPLLGCRIIIKCLKTEPENSIIVRLVPVIIWIENEVELELTQSDRTCLFPVGISPVHFPSVPGNGVIVVGDSYIVYDLVRPTIGE